MDEFKDLQELWLAERCEEGPIMIKITERPKEDIDF